MTLKTAACGIGNGLLAVGSAMHNATIDKEIAEIDDQMAALRKQMTRLEEERSDTLARRI